MTQENQIIDENELVEDSQEEVIKTLKEHTSFSINWNRENLNYDPSTQKFNPDVSWKDILRYLKGLYGENEERFKAYFVEVRDNNYVNDFINYALENFHEVEPFSYAEAFRIEDQVFRVNVFSSINIPEMISNLGHELASYATKEITGRVYDKDGTYLGDTTYENHYEVHKVYGEKIDAESDFYALRCWDTTTNEEHWVWLNKYYEDPKDAVASTFYMYESLIPYIKAIKRQGDIMVVELTEKVDPKENDNMVPLDQETYFNNLVCET